MKTPHNPNAPQNEDPLVAVVQAWNDPGLYPVWHDLAKHKVRDCMPMLAKALDRLSEETNE
jgi:hypothetical protein